MPAVVIPGAGDDAVRGRDVLQLGAEFGEGGGVFDDVVPGDEDEVRRFFFDGGDDFFEEFFIVPGSVVEVGEVGDAEAIERGRPVVESEVLPGDGEMIGFAEESPSSGGCSGGEHSEGGAAGEFFDR